MKSSTFQKSVKLAPGSVREKSSNEATGYVEYEDLWIVQERKTDRALFLAMKT